MITMDFGVEKLKFDNDIDEAVVSKRIILNGDNLNRC